MWKRLLDLLYNYIRFFKWLILLAKLNYARILLIFATLMVTSIFSIDKSDGFVNPHLEGSLGYFFFSNEKMRDVYFNGGFEARLSGSYPVYKQLQIYGSAGFRELWGRSVNFNEKTIFWEIPIDVGLRPVFKITSFIDWYFALGPRYFYFQQKNKSDFVDKTVARNGVGLFVNTGFDFFIHEGWFIDLFGQYSYEPISISPHQSEVVGRLVTVGGFSFGVGCGYSF